MISSELPEILGMSDRIAVMHGGRIVKILDRAEKPHSREFWLWLWDIRKRGMETDILTEKLWIKRQR